MNEWKLVWEDKYHARYVRKSEEELGMEFVIETLEWEANRIDHDIKKWQQDIDHTQRQADDIVERINTVKRLQSDARVRYQALMNHVEMLKRVQERRDRRALPSETSSSTESE